MSLPNLELSAYCFHLKDIVLLWLFDFTIVGDIVSIPIYTFRLYSIIFVRTIMSSLKRLPAEIVALVLLHLPVMDLIRCQQVRPAEPRSFYHSNILHKVSLFFKSLIQSNSSLQYKISLALACMEDAHSSTRPPRQKLRELHSFQKLWTGGTFVPTVIKSSVPYNEHMNLAQDTMVQGLGMRTLRFTRMSCELTGVPEKIWEVNLDFDIIEFAFDPDEDLLIAIEARENK